ncbi:hypothetical protein DLAC_03117 [Tieghemostelium lacteum]|uniref:Uncharacterized protein n=1 Tax=Tieghemostelium lacteum TaxID=361077 RepID=A0A152A287_TIELA|nr:hypothetical protein DLAC_03117 [Tieghemostelium lacteum]|eukprot:KYR00372.1 hypothetical protein DLAC_03117 [Tieghemostelium lacteum]
MDSLSLLIDNFNNTYNQYFFIFISLVGIFVFILLVEIYKKEKSYKDQIKGLKKQLEDGDIKFKDLYKFNLESEDHYHNIWLNQIKQIKYLNDITEKDNKISELKTKAITELGQLLKDSEIGKLKLQKESEDSKSKYEKIISALKLKVATLEKDNKILVADLEGANEKIQLQDSDLISLAAEKKLGSEAASTATVNMEKCSKRIEDLASKNIVLSMELYTTRCHLNSKISGLVTMNSHLLDTIEKLVTDRNDLDQEKVQLVNELKLVSTRSKSNDEFFQETLEDMEYQIHHLEEKYSKVNLEHQEELEEQRSDYELNIINLQKQFSNGLDEVKIKLEERILPLRESLDICRGELALKNERLKLIELSIQEQQVHLVENSRGFSGMVRFGLKLLDHQVRNVSRW